MGGEWAEKKCGEKREERERQRERNYVDAMKNLWLSTKT